jgi:hypothetical protein
MTLRGLSAPVLHIARDGIVVSPNPFDYPRAMLLALVMLATVVTFAPARGTLSTGLLYWDRNWGPDPKDYSASHPIGLVPPWVTVEHDWNEAAGRSGWRYLSFDRDHFAAHFALQSAVGGLVMVLWGRGRDRSGGGFNLGGEAAGSVVGE